MIRGPILAIAILFFAGCQTERRPGATAPEESIPVAQSFASPVGNRDTVTEAKDSKDDWYNALNFGDSNHLGEDWNQNSGGNTDCGEAVYAAANGVITFAGDAGPGWGNVLIVTHRLIDGSKVQSLYGHLGEISQTSGEVVKREKIGTVGNGNGRYLCHLHFEIRTPESPMWDAAGPGYAEERNGWLDPSAFIDERQKHDR
jgi:murein DD-endopeptidase MepM/ murein hydrolase activator NlpD